MKLKPKVKGVKPAVNTTSVKQVKKTLDDVAKKVQKSSVEEVMAEIEERKKRIAVLEAEIESLHKERIELLISPYKLGDKVLAEVQMGKTKKKVECILEAGSGETMGILYLRPFKEDGSLSGRRFMMLPDNDDYLSRFEPVK